MQSHARSTDGDSTGKSLSDFVSGVQMREIKDALHHYTLDGPMGQLLDAEEDGLTLGAFQCFEIEELMNMGERNLVPALTYLFHRIEKRLDGSPSLILLDEAWLMLGHPVFRDKIREWLKVLRKANCAVVLATQSISDAERSGIIDVLKESCPTKICLPNGARVSRAPASSMSGSVSTSARSRSSLVPSEARILRRHARRTAALRYVARAGGPELCRRIRKGRPEADPRAEGETRPDWPTHWLQSRGVHDATSHLNASNWIIITMTATIVLSPIASAHAGSATGAATEWTQLANNAQLIDLLKSSGIQVENQLTQITQLAEQIQNQLKIYENMLQNTARLPDNIWGQVESDLNRLRSIVDQGQSISFSMGNADDILQQRFKSYADLKTNLPNAETFSNTYQSWSDTNRDTIGSTLKAASLTADQFDTEEGTMSSLRSISQSADGQMKALQVGHQIAAQQVSQMQKLRGLVSQQMTMMGTWLQSEQSDKDLAQARERNFSMPMFPRSQADRRWSHAGEPLSPHCHGAGHPRCGGFRHDILFRPGKHPASSKISEEQRATRERFFGTAKELLPIERGQEMRPRW